MLEHKTTLAIVDDHPIVIEGLIKLLSNKKHIIELVGSFSCGKDIISFLKQQSVPLEIVLLDISLPDIDGIELCKEIKKISPDTLVLAFSNHYQRTIIMKLLQAGGSGYLLKSASIDELLKCINEAINGEITFSEAVKEIISKPQVAHSSGYLQITKREKEVLQLISLGKTTLDIAEELNLSKFTIEAHRKNILEKFKSKNVAELIKTASLEGLI